MNKQIILERSIKTYRENPNTIITLLPVENAENKALRLGYVGYGIFKRLQEKGKIDLEYLVQFKRWGIYCVYDELLLIYALIFGHCKVFEITNEDEYEGEYFGNILLMALNAGKSSEIYIHNYLSENGYYGNEK